MQIDTKKNEQINIELKKHQKSVDDWNHRSLADSLHIWTERFIFEFKLQCTIPALRLDRLRANCYGRFRIGSNGFGLLNDISINEKYINYKLVDFLKLVIFLH